MRVEFKQLSGYDYKYRVCNYGIIQKLRSDGWHKVHPYISDFGYLIVPLTKNGKRVKKRVHRLVAECFLSQEEHMEHINHKDENKFNNRVDNLEYCDVLYNINYGTREKKEIPIIQYDNNWKQVALFRSVSEAVRVTGYRNLGKKFREHIEGKRRMLYGYIWREIK